MFVWLRVISGRTNKRIDETANGLQLHPGGHKEGTENEKTSEGTERDGEVNERKRSGLVENGEEGGERETDEWVRGCANWVLVGVSR